LPNSVALQLLNFLARLARIQSHVPRACAQDWAAPAPLAMNKRVPLMEGGTADILLFTVQLIPLARTADLKFWP
jgi:hypothetical protein